MNITFPLQTRRERPGRRPPSLGSTACHSPGRWAARTPRLVSCCYREQVAHPDEVVRGQGEGKDPAYAGPSPVTSLPHQSDCLEPAEDLLDALAAFLTDRVRGMTCHSRVDRAVTHLLGDVRRRVSIAESFHKGSRVVRLIAADRDSLRSWNLVQELKGDRAFGRPRGLTEPCAHGQAVAVLHDYVAHEAQLGFVTLSLAKQTSLRIRRGLVCLVTSLLPMEVHGRVTRIVRRLLLRETLLLEALQRRPSLDQRAVHRKVLVGGKSSRACLRQHLLEEKRRNVALPQSVAVLREDRGVPHPIVHRKP